MSKKPTYIKLPIYSVTAYKNCIYFSGGGGGKTGIPNQIFIFQGRVTSEPKKRIDTGRKIIQNMTTNGKDQVLICSANQYIVIFKIQEKGLQLKKIHEFEGDYSFKNPTINCIFMHPSAPIFATGGDDRIFRTYSYTIKDNQAITTEHWKHQQHKNPIRNIDGTGKSFYLSTDQQKIVVVHIQQKVIIRSVYNDIINPLGSTFQSAYFNTFSYTDRLRNELPGLVICHYIPRSSAYISRELPNKMIETMKVSSDQSCLTARNHKYIGVASGNGTTYIIDPVQFKCVSEEKGHQFVITAATMTRGLKFITGTPECTYYLQQVNQSIAHHFIAIAFIILLIFSININKFMGEGEL